MKKAMVKGIASLITVGAIVGFSLRNANNDSKESEGIVLTASTTEQVTEPKESETLQATTTTTQVVKPAQETEVSFAPVDEGGITNFTYTVNTDVVNVEFSEIKFNTEINEIYFYHRFGYNENDYLVPTNIKIVDGAGNEGYKRSFGNTQSGCFGLDLTQKQYTIWYEFADNPDIGILRVDITLP